MELGVIGLGNIGGAIAANLAADGHRVTVTDLDADRTAATVDAGATAADGPAEVAAASEITLVSLPDPPTVRAVAEVWRDGAAPGSVLVDLSTTSPSSTRALGDVLAAGGCHLVESPLTGGAIGAQNRSLVFMVGGDIEPVERCRPVLESIGRAVFHLGPLGRGNTMKLVNSLIAFTVTWTSLEGLGLARKAGIPVATAVEVIRTGGASNFFIDRAVPGIDHRGRPPQFALAMAAKDATLVVELGDELDVDTPVGDRIREVLGRAVAAGLGDHDWSDLVELAERTAGIALHFGEGVES